MASARDALDDDPRFLELDDERWLFVPSLLDGTTWTTMVPATLPAVDALFADPDLTLLARWAIEEPIEIVGGRLSVKSIDSGQVATPAQVQVLRRVFDRCADRDDLVDGFGDEPPVELVRISLEDLLWEALVADRDAFAAAPIPPIDELLQEPVSQPWGARDCAFRDPSGNLVRIAQA